VGKQLRANSYKVKLTECYRVPSEIVSPPSLSKYQEVEDEILDISTDSDCPTSFHIPPTEIPQVLSQPPNANELASEPVTSETAEYVSSETRESLQPPDSHEHTRPTRERRPPKYLDDYVLS
jgi:hypothetical protein